MTQSRRMSLIEAITNVALGYALAVATKIVVFPWFGLNPNLSENLALGGAVADALDHRAQAVRALAAILMLASAQELCCGKCRILDAILR